MPAEDARRRFIEQFARYWSSEGGSEVEGRIAAFLLLDESEGATAEEITTQLGLSRGAVSNYTRALVEAGFVRRFRKPGSRADRHVMDADVWGGFLEHHQRYLRAQHELAAEMLRSVAPDTPAYERVRNMRDYMGWITEEMRLPQRWEEFKAARDEGADG